MTASRLLHAVTSASIAAIAAVALALGFQVTLFNIDVARMESSAEAAPGPGTRTQWVSTEPGPGTPTIDDAATLAGWQATPGVGSAARLLVATRFDARAFLPERLFQTTRTLSVAPTNGAQWLALAGAILRLGYGTEHALVAYDMAVLTARREGGQMFARALLVLREWEYIPDDRRAAAMTGLGEVGQRLGKAQVNAIRAALLAKSPASRVEIGAALPSVLAANKKFVKAIGL